MILKNELLNSCGIKIGVIDKKGIFEVCPCLCSRSVPACVVSFGALRGCVEMNFAPLEGVASNVVRVRGRLSPPLFCFLLINKAKSSE